ncbi:MAG: 3'(2'),5'-bisphosphate nucleotidase CysQ [Gammaproteobacteria bacterium]|nr:3'(2'),5'-bisphosphate nucleotidase CysQ [Gammaproteobacteria bacterium]
MQIHRNRQYSQADLLHICQQVLTIAKNAGEVILSYYQNFDPTKDLQHKPDSSPVTTADLAAHNFIIQALTNISLNNNKLDLPILSEESEDLSDTKSEHRLKWQDYWLIDPLDGTKEFIARTGEFCVSIALIENHRPILGVIHAPYYDLTYYAVLNGGAYKVNQSGQDKKIFTRKNMQQNIMLISSTRHHSHNKFGHLIHKFEQNNLSCNNIVTGSAIKFGLIAEGLADLYPRFGLTSEWDTAAGDIIVHEAGGLVEDLTGQKILYNMKTNVINPEFFAAGDKDFPWLHYLS